ncbi:unnamed protein product [marine sediment metagenome]|uniref:Uncharacterized protein n=1 Tax=marine sediment metagenome TaxID=412755 RepID=X1RZ56_9ZZZZ
MRYEKQTPRLTVKFVDSDTNTVLFELKDRTWMNVGELLNDGAVSSIMTNERKNKKVTQNLMVLVVGEYELKE